MTTSAACSSLKSKKAKLLLPSNEIGDTGARALAAYIDRFYSGRRVRLIYRAMLTLYEENEPVDSLTVTDRLKQMGKLEQVGGSAKDGASRGSASGSVVRTSIRRPA